MAYQTGDDLTQIISLLSSLSDQQYRKETREKSNVNDVFQNINNAMKIVNNVEGLTNMQNSLHNIQDSANKYGETAISYGVMDEALKSKKAQIGLFNSAVDQANDMINGTTFLEQTTDFTALTNPDSDIYSMIMGEKNADGTQRFASITDWISQEYGKTDNLQRKLKQGIEAGYNYNKKNISDGDAFNKIDSYKKRLDIAMQTLLGDEVITPEEAQLIVMGDKKSYDTVKTDKLTKIGAGIEEYDAMIKYLDKALSGTSAYIKSTKESVEDDDEVDSEFMADIFGSLAKEFPKEEDRQAAVNSLSEFGVDLNSAYLKTELIDAQVKYEEARNKLIDNWKMWDGYDYQGAFSKQNTLGDDTDFGDFANDDDANKNNQEEQIEADFLDETEDPELKIFESLTLEQQKEFIEKRKDRVREKMPPWLNWLSENPDAKPEEKLENMGAEAFIGQYLKGKDISKDELTNILNNKYLGSPDLAMSPEDLIKGYDNVIKHPDRINYFNEQVERYTMFIDEFYNMEKDKAADALKSFLTDSSTLTEALHLATPEDSPPRIIESDQFRWSVNRNKLGKFKQKFKNAKKKGTSLDEFINNNLNEFRNVARTLKYGKYWIKKSK
tara:strand:+ start:180 stop:2015 length:1836 start_codon:yes stop_codon:yes gene_type:complete